MEKFNVENMTSLQCAKEEEWANFEPNIVVIPCAAANSYETISVSIDSGSTKTRTRVFTTPGKPITEQKSLSSDIVTTADISNIKTKSNNLLSRLEFKITDLTNKEIKPNKMFEEETFVRGAMVNEVAGTPMPRPSKILKSKLLSTYLNIISSSAIELICKHNNGRLDKSFYKLNLTLALPPSEFVSPDNLLKFAEKLSGTYLIEMPRLFLRFTVKIDQEDIHFDKEPNAVQMSLANRYPKIAEKTSIGIDGGGKSTDYNLLDQGTINDDVARTGEYGGKKLIELIKKSYVKRTGKSSPRDIDVESALSTGLLVRGGVSEDISEDIIAGKNTITNLIFGDITAILDDADLNLDDIELLTFHGRLFRETILPDGRVISIVNLILSILEESGSGNIPEVMIIEEDSVISEGMIYSKWIG